MPRLLAVVLIAMISVSLSSCKDAAAPPASGAAPGAGGAATGTGAPAVEAKENLRAIGTGAELYFQNEHVDPDNPMTTSSRVFPPATEAVCSAGGEGEVSDPSATDWTASPWKELGFSVTRPHHFSYCYQSSPDGKRFAAWAETETSAFCLIGAAETDAPRLRPVFELKVDQYCEF